MSTPRKSNTDDSQLEERLALRRQIAEEILGPVHWRDPVTGFVRCPGAELHTSESTNDVQVKIDGAPTIHCFHANCREVVAEANFTLRSRVGTAEKGQEPLWVTASQQPDRKQDRARQRAELARWSGELQLALRNATSPGELLRQSPKPITWREEDDWKHLIRLYDPRDTIWMGEITDSNPAHFRQVAEWLQWSRCPGSRICPSTFPYRCQARTKANVVSRRFLVVESDELSIPQQTGLLLHLGTIWPLAAVVFSGGRSLHGWFKWRAAWAAKGAIPLRLVLGALHCDPSAADPQQPFRLPGAIRPEKARWQSLLYLNPANGHGDYE